MGDFVTVFILITGERHIGAVIRIVGVFFRVIRSSDPVFVGHLYNKRMRSEDFLVHTINRFSRITVGAVRWKTTSDNETGVRPFISDRILTTSGSLTAQSPESHTMNR